MTEMDLQDIYSPIENDLLRCQAELKRQINMLAEIENSGDADIGRFGADIINYFFNISGKMLRPALVFFSARAVCPQLDDKPGSPQDTGLQEQLTILATAIEFIHGASLAHDDIIDKEIFRRGQASLNERFGNRIAVLAGDLLFIQAFKLLTQHVSRPVLLAISECTATMCRGEIGELTGSISSLSEYMAIIKAKTGSFMSTCCQTGASLTGADSETVHAITNFGMHFGTCYQLLDDYLDEDISLGFKINLLETAETFAAQAREDLQHIKASAYKECLNNLLEYVLARSNRKQALSL